MRGIICVSLLGIGLVSQGLAARPAAADVSITIGVPIYAPPPRYYYYPPPPPAYVVAPPPYWYAPPPRYVAVPVYPRYHHAPPGHRKHGKRW